MSKKQITGTVKNSSGAITPFTGEIEIVEAPVISSVTVTPPSAVAGTIFAIKVSASDPQGQALTYECNVDGMPATPTGSPGEFTWKS